MGKNRLTKEEFNKQFPSLKKKGADFKVIECEYPFDGRRKSEVITNDKRFCEDVSKIIPITPISLFGKRDIQDNCLDKSLVEKALDKDRIVKDDGTEINQILNQIKKELEIE